MIENNERGEVRDGGERYMRVRALRMQNVPLDSIGRTYSRVCIANALCRVSLQTLPQTCGIVVGNPGARRAVEPAWTVHGVPDCQLTGHCGCDRDSPKEDTAACRT